MERWTGKTNHVYTCAETAFGLELVDLRPIGSCQIPDVNAAVVSCAG